MIAEQLMAQANTSIRCPASGYNAGENGSHELHEPAIVLAWTATKSKTLHTGKQSLQTIAEDSIEEK